MNYKTSKLIIHFCQAWFQLFARCWSPNWKEKRRELRWFCFADMKGEKSSELKAFLVGSSILVLRFKQPKLTEFHLLKSSNNMLAFIRLRIIARRIHLFVKCKHETQNGKFVLRYENSTDAHAGRQKCHHNSCSYRVTISSEKNTPPSLLGAVTVSLFLVNANLSEAGDV